MSLNITKGEWFVRTRKSGGVIVDCFVAAKNANGCAYDSEILGDDEYGHADGDIDRKIADADLIAEAGTVANECGLTPRQLLEQRNELLKLVEELVSPKNTAFYHSEISATYDFNVLGWLDHALDVISKSKELGDEK